MCSDLYKVLESQNNIQEGKYSLPAKNVSDPQRYSWLKQNVSGLQKKHGLENRTMWPVAIIGLLFWDAKIYFSCKRYFDLQKNPICKKHFEKAGWLWPLAIDLVSGPQPLSSCRARRSCKTRLEFYLRFKKSKERQKIQRLSVRIATSLIMSLATTGKRLYWREK